MNFFDYDFNVTSVELACKVFAGTGNVVHNNRPSHGLAFNVGGEKRYTFDGEKTLTVTANDIIFLPERSNYSVSDVVSGDCYAVNFKISEQKIFEPFVFHPKNPADILEMFSSAEKIFKAKKCGYMYKCKSELYSLLHTMFCEHNSEYFPTYRIKSIAPSIEYIHNHYADEDITITFLAKLCGIKEAYFRRTFSVCLNTSPIKYINNLRLARAKELLSQNEYSIETVSEMSGFNNLCYFHRYFKKNVGLTPNEYRKNKNREFIISPQAGECF